MIMSGKPSRNQSKSALPDSLSKNITATGRLLGSCGSVMLTSDSPARRLRTMLTATMAMTISPIALKASSHRERNRGLVGGTSGISGSAAGAGAEVG
jgi:hypothetical protein